MFCGVNPSRAVESELTNDNTIGRCVNFAKEWGYGGLYFANLYSFRTPYMKGPLKAQQIAEGWKPLTENLDVAIGEECDAWLKKMISQSEKVICAWGSWQFAGFEERAKEVLGFIPEPYCLGVNADGQPKHPLYLKADSQPVKYGGKKEAAAKVSRPRSG